MKKHVISIGCAMAFGLLLTACGHQDAENSTTDGIFSRTSPCATAPALSNGKILVWPFYRTMTQDNFFTADGNTFSDYGMEVTMEVVKSGPLNGMGYTSRRTCSQAFVLKDGRKEYLEKGRLPGSHRIIAEVLDKSYVLLSGTLGEGKAQQTELVKLNIETGQRQQFALEATPLGGCYASLNAIPSPSGEFILSERLKSKSCGMEQTKSDLRLSLLNADLKELASPYSGEFTAGVRSSWVSETEYQVKDDERTVSFAVPAL